uniref:Myb-like, SWIRM and MPN domain-containing protein 1 n=1 Tax=Denticeps clupeoides TaxID=299321 RepID=A0AAY4D449_9TELE
MAAEEVDVDVEGEPSDGGGAAFRSGEGVLLRDRYLQSAWKDGSSLLPWALDGSISAENREVIENMLLEEQFYLAGKSGPKGVWTSGKPKVKKKSVHPSPVRSPVKTSGAPARWAAEEKDLFEKGLAQFGRRWTKISKLIGSRTVLQVKSYARQYFRNKVGLLPGLSVAPQPAQRRMAALTNAVRIERLSDDEDVDITDDLDDPGSQTDDQECVEEQEPRGVSSPGPLSPPEAHVPDEDCIESRTKALSDAHSSGEEPENLEATPFSVDNNADGPDETEPEDGQEEENDDDQEEEEEIKAPEQEVTLDKNNITEEEKQAIPEFFEGRPSKTPERYLRIRNYILEQWENGRPRYLNKTSVRPGLKNCGDVNCIGRIHTYLELIGAINFSCDQAVYNRPRPVERSRLKETRDALESYQLAQRLQSMRTRKRRVRDVHGNWCDAKDLEGQTFEHLSAEELALRRAEQRKLPRPGKLPRQRGSDPFLLVPCQTFGEQKQEPFQVVICAGALVVMDLHAHVSMGEVIGLLGGAYDEEQKVLKVRAAEPCNSLSTGLQCEMDPVSQTQASELLGVRGHSVVGWYHSHPTFDPNPSVRDMDTQAKYQSYFSRGGAPFVGMIISPYNPSNSSAVSQTTCLVVSEEEGPSGAQKVPYRFEVQVSGEVPDWEAVMRRAGWVPLMRKTTPTCSTMDFLQLLPEVEVSGFLLQIEHLLITKFGPAPDSEVSSLFMDEPSPPQPINSDEASHGQEVQTEQSDLTGSTEASSSTSTTGSASLF